MDPSRRVPSAPVSPTIELLRDSESPDEADNNGTPANNAPTSQPPLRSQAEFLMTGVLPVPDQPERPCSICVENLTEDVVQMARCRHTFHTTCVLRWFQSRAERRGACPDCREELFDLALPASPEPSNYTPQYGTPQEFGGGVGFVDGRSAPSGAEARTRTRAEIERERDYLRWSQELRLLSERGRDRLRGLEEFIESESARPGLPASGRRTFSSSLSISNDVRAEGQAARGLLFKPPRPSPETTVAQNEHAREYARNLVRARQHRMPAPSRDIQATHLPSRVNVGPPDRRQVIASMTIWRLQELLRDDTSSAEIRVQCEQELTFRRAESNLYASPTAQVSQREHESARPPEATFGASSSYINMRQTGIFGPRSPRLMRDETFARADAQRREEREAEAIRRQERFGQLHAEQATTAAQDPSTLYSDPRMPAILPPVPRTPFEERGNVCGPSSIHRFQSLLSEGLRGARNIDGRRSDLRSQSPLPEGTQGARNRAPANDSFRGFLARHGLEESATPANVLWGPAFTRIIPSQDAEDWDAVDGSAGNTIADDFDLAMRWAERE